MAAKKHTIEEQREVNRATDSIYSLINKASENKSYSQEFLDALEKERKRLCELENTFASN